MNIQKMMQQAQEMQGKLQSMQEKIGEQEVTGSAGGGVVSVTMTCKGYVNKVDIDAQSMKPEDKEIVEDLIAAACNDARGKADEKMAEETKKMMEEMGLPSNMQLPF